MIGDNYFNETTKYQDSDEYSREDTIFPWKNSPQNLSNRLKDLNYLNLR